MAHYDGHVRGQLIAHQVKQSPRIFQFFRKPQHQQIVARPQRRGKRRGLAPDRRPLTVGTERRLNCVAPSLGLRFAQVLGRSEIVGISGHGPVHAIQLNGQRKESLVIGCPRRPSD